MAVGEGWYKFRSPAGWEMITNNKEYAASMCKELGGVVITDKGSWRWTGRGGWQKELFHAQED